MLLSNLNAKGVCDKLGWSKLPAIIETYMFCCPAMDLNIRFLPRSGGYYNQYYIDMKWFRVIESQIIIHTNREAQKTKHGV